MIPRRLHWCWFSGETPPPLVEKCRASWERFLPGFEIVKWDEGKARAVGLPWIDKALDERRWAFAADAVRVHAVLSEGGVYLDSDVELLKPLDPLLERSCFFGRENGSDRIEGAVFGAEPGNALLRAALRFYETAEFSWTPELSDDIVLPKILLRALDEAPGTEILPEDRFSPKSFVDGKIRTTGETFCVHHFGSFWRNEAERKGILRRQALHARFPAPVARLLSAPLSVWTNLRAFGIRGTLRKIAARF